MVYCRRFTQLNLRDVLAGVRPMPSTDTGPADLFSCASDDNVELARKLLSHRGANVNATVRGCQLGLLVATEFRLFWCRSASWSC